MKKEIGEFIKTVEEKLNQMSLDEKINLLIWGQDSQSFDFLNLPKFNFMDNLNELGYDFTFLYSKIDHKNFSPNDEIYIENDKFSSTSLEEFLEDYFEVEEIAKYIVRGNKISKDLAMYFKEKGMEVTFQKESKEYVLNGCTFTSLPYINKISLTKRIDKAPRRVVLEALENPDKSIFFIMDMMIEELKGMLPNNLRYDVKTFAPYIDSVMENEDILCNSIEEAIDEGLSEYFRSNFRDNVPIIIHNILWKKYKNSELLNKDWNEKEVFKTMNLLIEKDNSKSHKLTANYLSSKFEEAIQICTK